MKSNTDGNSCRNQHNSAPVCFCNDWFSLGIFFFLSTGSAVGPPLLTNMFSYADERCHASLDAFVSAAPCQVFYMPQRRESQHCYLGLTASQTSDLLLKGRTCEGAYWSKWSKWEQSARESPFNLCHTDQKTSCCNCKVPVIMQSCERMMYASV